MYHSLLIHSPTERHLTDFMFWQLWIKLLRSMCRFLCICNFSTSLWIKISWVAGSYSTSMFSFVKQLIYFPKWLYNSAFPTGSYEISWHSISSRPLWVPGFQILAILIAALTVASCFAFTAWHMMRSIFSHMCICHLYIFFAEVFGPLSNQVAFLLLSLKVLGILDNSPFAPHASAFLQVCGLF